MDLQAFFAENTPPFPEERVKLSERLGGEFRIRGISEEESAGIRRQCVKNAAGETDPADYLCRLAAACVVEPDLQNAALQRSWGVMGAEDLLKRMLSAGEYAKLVERVQAVCGFDLPVREMAYEIKKGSCRATQN